MTGSNYTQDIEFDGDTCVAGVGHFYVATDVDHSADIGGRDGAFVCHCEMVAFHAPHGLVDRDTLTGFVTEAEIKAAEAAAWERADNMLELGELDLL